MHQVLFASIAVVIGISWLSTATLNSAPSSSDSALCPAQGNTRFKLRILSVKNESGHWKTNVHMDHGNNGEVVPEDPWELDVDHTVSKCGDQEVIAIDAWVVSPEVKPPQPAPTTTPEPIVTTPKPEPEKVRPKGYNLVKETGYYRVYSEPKNWFDALDTCRNDGSELFIPSNETEVANLVPMLRAHPKPFRDWRDNVYWIGIHDFFQDKKYVDVLSRPLKYNKWSSEPTHFNEKCGMIDTDGNMGDATCDTKLLFICEQEL